MILGAALVLARPIRAQQPTVTLSDAIRLAEKVQPSMVQARGAIDNAGAQVRSAKGAYLPNLNATSSGGTSFSTFARPDPSTGAIGKGATTVNMGLSASVDLFTGFRRGADNRAARATENAAQVGLVDARYQVALTTTQTFFDALSAKQLARVRQASVDRAGEQLKVSIAKLRSGSATRSDSLRSLVNLGNARLQLINTEAQLAQAEADLARLIGAPGRVAALDDSSFYGVSPVDSTALLEEVQAHAPRVVSAEASAAAARATVASSKAGYWPTLSLSASTNWNGDKATSYQLGNQRQLFLNLNWPIFTRFSREQNIVSHENSLDLALANAADARRQVQAAMTGQLALLDAALLRIEITTTSVAAAEEDLRVQRERYRVGAATILDVLTSEEALTQAEVDVVNARFDYLRAKAQIEALIGRAL